MGISVLRVISSSMIAVALIMIIVLVLWAGKRGYLKLKWYTFSVIIVLFILFALNHAYSRDMNRMRYGLPVKFSTWGQNPFIVSRGNIFRIKMMPSNKEYASTVKVTSEEFKETYGYNIYYNQLDSITTFNNMDFIESLEIYKVTLEMFLEGLEYCTEIEFGDYELYENENHFKYIIHLHTYEPYYSIIVHNNNIYIGLPTMQFEDVI